MGERLKNILSHFGIGGPSSSKVVAPAPMILLKNIGDRTSFFLLNVTDALHVRSVYNIILYYNIAGTERIFGIHTTIRGRDAAALYGVRDLLSKT